MIFRLVSLCRFPELQSGTQLCAQTWKIGGEALVARGKTATLSFVLAI